MPAPKNGEVRLPVDVPQRLKDLLEAVKIDTGHDYKRLVAWACFRVYRDHEKLTLAEIRKLRREFEQWVESGEGRPRARASPAGDQRAGRRGKTAQRGSRT